MSKRKKASNECKKEVESRTCLFQMDSQESRCLRKLLESDLSHTEKKEERKKKKSEEKLRRVETRFWPLELPSLLHYSKNSKTFFLFLLWRKVHNNLSLKKIPIWDPRFLDLKVPVNADRNQRTATNRANVGIRGTLVILRILSK